MTDRRFERSLTQQISFLAAVIAIGVAFLVSAPAAEQARLPPVKDTSGKIIENGIVEMQKIQLGGVEQWILVRGQSLDNPVLLFLHGGPGGTIVPWVDLFHTPELEEHFTIVHWDQRGSGKSYDPNLTVEDVRPEKFVADTLELTARLQKWFGKEKYTCRGNLGAALWALW